MKDFQHGYPYFCGKGRGGVSVFGRMRVRKRRFIDSAPRRLWLKLAKGGIAYKIRCHLLSKRA